MKTKLFFLFVAISVFTIRIDAQLKVHSSGGISLGTTTDPGNGKISIANPIDELNVNGLEMSVTNGYYGVSRVSYQFSDGYYNIDLATGSKVSFTTDLPYYQFDEDILSDGIWLTSDTILKENVKKISEEGSSIEKVKKLEGITYNLIEDKYKLKYAGFSAQELQKVLPDLVFEDEDGVLSVNYLGLTPYLVEAIKEQESRIQEIEKILNIQPIHKGATNDLAPIPSPTSMLEQNSPNPFSNETYIKYSISEVHSNAMVNVYDLQGQQIRSYGIYSEGTGKIIINRSDLNPGIFIYNLIVDGIEIDSKRMILTD